MAGNSVCYATAADLAMLGLPDNVLKKVDAQTIQRHLEIASGTINSYLRSQYKLPIKVDSTTGLYPAELVTACVYLASYSVIQFIGYNPNSADSRFEDRYHDMVGNSAVSGSRGWLDRVASGAVSLNIEVDQTPGTNEGGPRVNTQPARGWNLDVLSRPNTKFI